MPSIAEHFERMQRSEYLNPSSKWPLIVGGLAFLFAAAITQTRTHDLSRAAVWLSIGCGTILYGVTEISFRRSALRWPLTLIALVLWLGGVYWSIRIMF
jgi:hypothetical protein